MNLMNESIISKHRPNLIDFEFQLSILIEQKLFLLQYLIYSLNNIFHLKSYQLANLYLIQNKLSLAEKTAFDIIKKQASYEFWVTSTYILLGDIYVAQKDSFNAIATYKSVADNATIETLKIVAAQKLKELTETPTIK